MLQRFLAQTGNQSLPTPLLAGDSTTVGSQPESQQTPSEAISELQRKLEKVHISNTQQVVIPTHINVTEVGKLGFCFGSFDASFGLEMTEDGSLGSDKSTPLTESFDSTVDPSEVLQLRSSFRLPEFWFTFFYYVFGLLGQVITLIF